MPIEPPETPALVTHVVFEPGTGRILGTLRHDPADGHDEDCRCHEDEDLLRTFQPAGTPEHVLPQLAASPAGKMPRLDRMRVDPGSRLLQALPQLVVDPERTVMEGDGEDTIALEIRAVDEQGAVMEDFDGEVHVSAGRGKLSARGGTVRLERGRATVRLTSVRETVDTVPVVVRASGGEAAAARASLAFE